MKNWLWENPSLRTLAWTLLHLLWQGALIAGLLAVGLALMRKRSAQARYLASCVTLVLIAIAPAGTYRYLTASEGMSSANALPTITLTTTNSMSVIHLLTPYLPHLVLLWGIGVTFLSLRLLFGWVGIYRLGHIKTMEVSTSIRDRANELARQLGITCRVEVLASGIAEVPMTFGLARRVILLPVSALLGLSPTILEAILAHELAHIRRHDYLVNLIQTAIETLFFYHPAVWWISRQIRNERENACDDMAVSLLGNRMTYARALASVEELRSVPSMALAINQGDLLARIQRVLGVAPAKQRLSPVHALTTLSIVMGVFTTLFYVSMTPVKAKKSVPTLEVSDVPSSAIAKQYEVALATPKASKPLGHTPHLRAMRAHKTPNTVHATAPAKTSSVQRVEAVSKATISSAFEKAVEQEMEKAEPSNADDKDIPDWVKPMMKKAKSDVLKSLREGNLEKTLGKTALNAVRNGLKLAQEEMKKALSDQREASTEQAKALKEAEREIREAYMKIDN